MNEDKYLEVEQEFSEKINTITVETNTKGKRKIRFMVMDELPFKTSEGSMFFHKYDKYIEDVMLESELTEDSESVVVGVGLKSGLVLVGSDMPISFLMLLLGEYAEKRECPEA